jgi:hypothetical protein
MALSTGSLAVSYEGYTMLLDEDRDLPRQEVDQLFAEMPVPRAVTEVSDTLYSDLVRCFEQSIEDGMKPIESLTTILGWLSHEMARISGGQAGPDNQTGK